MDLMNVLITNQYLRQNGSGGGGGSDSGAEKYFESAHEIVELPNVTAIRPYAFCHD